MAECQGPQPNEGPERWVENEEKREEKNDKREMIKSKK